MTNPPLPIAAGAPRDDALETTRYWMERALLATGPRTELILVRHGLQLRSRDEESRPGGPSLSEHGVRQARAVGALLAEDRASALYCSDFNRARQTAEVIAEQHHHSVESRVRPDLHEVHIYGRAENGLPASELQAEASRDFYRTRRWDSFPDTESSEDFRTRISGAMSSLATEHPDERIIVVGHGGVFSTFLSAVLGIDDDMWFYAAHTSVTRVFFGDGRWSVRAINETHHLTGDLLTY